MIYSYGSSDLSFFCPPCSVKGSSSGLKYESVFLQPCLPDMDLHRTCLLPRSEEGIQSMDVMSLPLGVNTFSTSERRDSTNINQSDTAHMY